MSARHLFPSRVAEPSWHWQGDVPSITFTHRMSCTGELFILAKAAHESCSGLYVGTMLQANSAGSDERIEVVVKFTDEFNAHTHRILDAAGFAPALHACVPVCGGVQMVVIDRVKGEMAWRAERRSELLPYTVYEHLRIATDLLHREGLVFGDLHSRNVMCVLRGDDRSGAMLVDFGLSITRCSCILVNAWAESRLSVDHWVASDSQLSFGLNNSDTKKNPQDQVVLTVTHIQPRRIRSDKSTRGCAELLNQSARAAASSNIAFPGSCHPPLHIVSYLLSANLRCNAVLGT